MDCQKVVHEVIEGNKDRLNNISKEIWSNPETSFQEQHAHDVLTAYLAEEGFQVERNFVSSTGFRAIFGVPGTSVAECSATEQQATPKTTVNACFLCEYDAVPEIGHAAGHNLSTEASIAAAIGLKKCIRDKRIDGMVTVLGTPAEDSGRGLKIDMLEQGAFNDVSFCMMLSPMNANILYPKSYTLVLVTVQYTGKAAHASAFSWEGKNALDAAVACYTNIALLRQQMKPSWNISGIITKGGIQPNVIPQSTELKFWLRAPDARDLVLMQQRCQACFVAAAKATGCEVEFNFNSKQYYPMEQNKALGSVYKLHAETLGIEFSSNAEALEGLHKGSSDMGNVSQIVPCINPAYDINTASVINSAAFHDASGTPEAHDNTLKAALAMTYTALSILCDQNLLTAVQEEHETEHKQCSLSALVRKASESQ